jgi:ribosomal protein S24E
MGIMYKCFFTLLCVASLSAEIPPIEYNDNSKIAVQNSILAKVNGTTISMIDVKKKMDLLFHQNYPHLAQSTQARYQFYDGSWRHLLMETIDHQLILADAVEKEVKLTDGEIREEMETRFGPNIMFTLDKIGLTYDETWKMVREELLVRRMTWWFIHSKAMHLVTPHDIRQAFRMHLKENPAYQEWKYRVISIRGERSDEIAGRVQGFLSISGLSPESLTEQLKAIDPSIQVSSEYALADKDLSDAHKEALSLLIAGQYSAPKLQKSRVDNKTVARIFYLSQKIDHPAPQFDELSHNLRNDLIQKAVAQESTVYIEKLRRHYGFDTSHLKERIPDDLHPFSLE